MFLKIRQAIGANTKKLQNDLNINIDTFDVIQDFYKDLYSKPEYFFLFNGLIILEKLSKIKNKYFGIIIKFFININ